MPGINATGLSSGSGLDVEGLVGKLVTAERAPIEKRLNRQEAQVQSHISALGMFRSALAEFQGSLSGLRNESDLHKVNVSTSHDSVEVSANRDAQEGEYQIDVLQLAQAQRLSSRAFESPLEPIGRGALSFQFGRVDPQTGRFEVNPHTQVRTLQIDNSNNSLRGIKEAINQANFGVKAALINDGSGHRLVLTSAATGEINAMRILVNDEDGDDVDAGGLSQLSYDVLRADGLGANLTEVAAAQDGRVRIDGIEISRPSNQIDNAIEGLSIKIKALNGAEPVRVATRFDSEALQRAVNEFVAAYNELNTVMQAVAGFNPETKQAGPLSGDATVRSVIAHIRRQLSASFASVNSEFVSLASLGIDSQRDGTLVVNTSKLNEAVSRNRQELTQVFAESGSASDSLVRYHSANDETEMGAYALRVTQMPKAGFYLGAPVATLNDVNIAERDNTLVLNVNGATSGTITLPAGTYPDATALAEELTRQINADSNLRRARAEVVVKPLRGQLLIESKQLGGQSRLDVVSAGTALRLIGIDAQRGIEGLDVQGSLGDQPAEGIGNRLVGQGAAQGLQVEVLGGQAGDRGEVFFSRGIAEQLNTIANRYLGQDGILTARNKGFDSRIQDIGRQRDQLDRRMASNEQRLLKQFSSLDALLGKMRQTSTFLSNHLSKLPGAAQTGSTQGKAT